jgi:hypothetical protein
MNELKKSLEKMRDMVAGRIEMLQEGITFYDDAKKAYYLQEYRCKLRDLDQQILSLSLTAKPEQCGKGPPRES